LCSIGQEICDGKQPQLPQDVIDEYVAVFETDLLSQPTNHSKSSWRSTVMGYLGVILIGLRSEIRFSIRATSLSWLNRFLTNEAANLTRSRWVFMIAVVYRELSYNCHRCPSLAHRLQSHA
jgi:hypothetical protein